MNYIYYTQEDDTASRILGTEAVIVKLTKGKITVLNESASILWTAAENPVTKQTLSQLLSSSYKVQKKIELTDFLEELCTLELLKKTSAKTESSELPIPSPAGIYLTPKIKTSENLETLAGICGSGYDPPLYPSCRNFGSCVDPWN